MAATLSFTYTQDLAVMHSRLTFKFYVIKEQQAKSFCLNDDVEYDRHHSGHSNIKISPQKARNIFGANGRVKKDNFTTIKIVSLHLSVSLYLGSMENIQTVLKKTAKYGRTRVACSSV